MLRRGQLEFDIARIERIHSGKVLSGVAVLERGGGLTEWSYALSSGPDTGFRRLQMVCTGSRNTPLSVERQPDGLIVFEGARGREEHHADLAFCLETPSHLFCLSNALTASGEKRLKTEGLAISCQTGSATSMDICVEQDGSRRFRASFNNSLKVEFSTHPLIAVTQTSDGWENAAPFEKSVSRVLGSRSLPGG